MSSYFLRWVKWWSSRRDFYLPHQRSRLYNRSCLPVCVSVWVCESHVVHHQPVLCTTDLHCAPWCTIGTYITVWRHVKLHNECLRKRAMKCPMWKVRERSGIFISITNHIEKWNESARAFNVLSANGKNTHFFGCLCFVFIQFSKVQNTQLLLNGLTHFRTNLRSSDVKCHMPLWWNLHLFFSRKVVTNIFP